MQLKPALTYKAQIDRLINVHNLKITNKNEAIKILKQVNYYRLSGYGIGLKKKNNPEEYRDGITLKHLYKLYCFDSALRNALVHLIEQLEIQLRAQISYLLAIKYGPEGYMNISNFSDKVTKDGDSVHNRIIKKFEEESNRQKNIPFVKHHITKYKRHFPIWVAVELFTFGNLSSLYSILKKEDQKEIASIYKTKPEYLTSWILSMVEIRNICAHYVRLYNMPLKQEPRLYSEHRKYASKRIHKLFPALIVLRRMTCPTEHWENFYNQLKKLMDSYQDVVNLSFMDFPAEWEKVLGLKKTDDYKKQVTREETNGKTTIHAVVVMKQTIRVK